MNLNLENFRFTVQNFDIPFSFGVFVVSSPSTGNEMVITCSVFNILDTFYFQNSPLCRYRYDCRLHAVFSACCRSRTDRAADRRVCRERLRMKERERETATRSLNVLYAAFTKRCYITAYKIAHRELNYFRPSPVEAGRALTASMSVERDGFTQITAFASIKHAKLSTIFWG